MLLPSCSPKCSQPTWTNLQKQGSEQTNDTEQGSEDRDRLPSKGPGVPPQSRDRLGSSP